MTDYKAELDAATELLKENRLRLEAEMSTEFSRLSADHVKTANEIARSLAQVAREARAWEERQANVASNLSLEEQFEALLDYFRGWPMELKKRFVAAIRNDN